jgi:hypothetical protein
MNRFDQVLGMALALALILLGVTACDSETEAKKEVVNISGSDPRAILAPGKAGVLSGTTLLVPRVPGTYHVYSVPESAGVENPGEAGIGTSIGYNPGERVLLPINVNLGAQVLDSYTIILTLQNPAAIRIVDVDGSLASLPVDYPDQYSPAKGFETQPVVSIGNPVTTISATSTSAKPTTGRVNLANVTVDILGPGPLPPAGAVITFTLDSLQTPGGQDICAILTGDTCDTFDGIVIENFKIH